MNDEAAFLAAIAAAPDDTNLQLVFADWLEEHDDPRGKWFRDRHVREWMGAAFADPVPRILDALARDKNAAAARRAAEVIGSPLLPGLIGLLTHASAVARQQACMCLRRLGPSAKNAAPALLALLADSESGVREKAAVALKAVGLDDAADLSRLKTALTDTNRTVRAAASELLGTIGATGDAFESLAERFESPDAKDRLGTIDGLAQLGTPEAVRVLDRALDYPNAEVRFAAVAALGRLDSADAAPPLARAMASADVTVRLPAVEQFARYSRCVPFTPEVIEALAATLSVAAMRMRVLACQALGKAGSFARTAVPNLLASLNDPAREVRTAAAAALGDAGRDMPETVGPLLDRLADEPDVAGYAAIALGKWTVLPDAVVPALTEYVRRARAEGDWRMPSGRGLEALGKVVPPPPAVVELLRSALADRRDREVWHALDALKGFGPAAAPAVPELLALFHDDYARVVGVLAAIGGSALDGLAEALGNSDEKFRVGVLQQMWEAGPAGAPLLPVLTRLLPRASRRERSLILSAIGRFGPAAAPAVPDLLALLDAPPADDCSGEVFNALAFMGPALVPHLPQIAALVGKPHLAGARSSLAFRLANIAEHTPDALDPLRTILRATHDDDWNRKDTRRGVLQGLNIIADKYAPAPDAVGLVADLAPLTDDSDTTTLEGLTTLLGRLGSPGAPLLCRLLANTSVGIRAKAADALTDAGDTSEETLAALVRAVEDREPKVRRAAIDTLNKLKAGTPEVLAALEFAAGDTEPKVAERAAVAVKKLTPKTSKPAAPNAKGKKKA